MKQLKILYLEDSKADADLVNRALYKSGFDFILKQAENKQSFCKYLSEYNPDIILSDHTLYQFDSIEAMEIMKEMKIDVPFILVTGTVSEEFAVTIMKMGANDYILKNNLARLPIAITNAIKEHEIKMERTRYQIQLEEKNEELKTLIYKLTHDLRGPVCSVLGLVDIALKENPANDYLSKINDSILKLDFILFSLIDTMYMKTVGIVSEEIDFYDLLSEIIKKFEFIEGFKKVNIQSSIEVSDPFFTDKKTLVSILQNLIENAFKYRNPAFAAFINITIRQNNENVIIKISDNGIGIDPASQGKIYDMFYRASNDSKGSGLGLYLVKNGIGKLNGTIELESELKVGTSFTITIPNDKKPVSSGN